MINLNKLNGVLEIDKQIFNADTHIDDIVKLKNIFEIKPYNVDNDSGFWTIPDIDEGKTSLMFLFQKKQLKWIQVGIGRRLSETMGFPPFTITQEETEKVKELLHKMGGENEYPWGKVQLSIDKKGGSVTVIIQYN